MGNPCGQTNIPEVDNTELQCDSYVYDSCIIIKEAIPYLGVPSNATLAKLVERLLVKLKAQARKIKELEKRIEDV